MIKRALGQEPEMEQAKQMRKIVKNIFFKNITVLDIGCGCGHFTHSLNKLHKPYNYLGIDISEPYIKLATACFKNLPNIKFQKGSIFNLKRIGAHDLVICYMVLPFIPNWQKAIINLSQAAKKYCLIRAMLDNDKNYIVKISDNAYDKRFEYYNTYKTSNFISCLKKYGFKKISVIDEKFNIELPKRQEEFATYTAQANKEKLQIIGNLVLNWKTVLAEK